MLHFAYGSNMSRALMGVRCPAATALGTATLEGWRFVIGVDAYASVVRQPGGVVHGVLWRLAPRELAALNAYEGIESGLYVRRMLVVQHRGRRERALVYVARLHGEGRPRPGYIPLVVDAAREWALPDAYIRTLQRWSPSSWRGARAKDTGEAG